MQSSQPEDAGRGIPDSYTIHGNENKYSLEKTLSRSNHQWWDLLFQICGSMDMNFLESVYGCLTKVI